MSETTFTFRVEERLKESFANAAKGQDRTAAQLLRDFMRQVVQGEHEAANHDLWFRQQVQIGLDSADAGRIRPNEAVEAEFAQRRALAQQKIKTKL